MKGGGILVQGADPRYPHHCGKTFLESEKRRVPGVTLGFCPSALFGPPLQTHKVLPPQWPSTLQKPSVQGQAGTGSWWSRLQRWTQPILIGAREGLSVFPRKHGH